MKTLFLLCVLCALGVGSSFARIGENEAQIEARYGKALKDLEADIPGTARRMYAFKDYTICVTFIDGASEMELIGKKDEHTKLDPREIEAILALNAEPGQTWRSAGDFWIRADRKLTASFWFGTLEIKTERAKRLSIAAVQTKAAERKAEEEKRAREQVKGF